MEKWVEQFSNHAVHGTIASIQKELDSLDLANDNHGIAADVSRLGEALNHIRHIFDRCLSHLANINVLNKINNQITAANTELVAFKQDNNRAHFDTINTHVDAFVQQALGLPVILVDTDGDSLSSIISSFSKKSQKVIDEAILKRKELETEFSGVKNSLAALQKDFKGLVDNFNNQQQSINNLSAEYQKQFAEQQESRRKEFADKIKEVQDRITALLKEVTDKLDTQKKELEEGADKGMETLQSKVDALVESLKEKDNKASRLLEAVGIKSHTYGYAGVSKQEGDAAGWLRFFAIILMLCAVAILVGPSLIDLIKHQVSFDWKNILYRIPTSLIVFIPGIYLASEAAKHRKVHVENKRIELELAALSPYLELFKDDDKNKIKEELVKNYFVGHSQNANEKLEKKKAEWLEDVIPDLLDKIIEKFLDRFPSFNFSPKDKP